jgi:hypothetical protein
MGAYLPDYVAVAVVAVVAVELFNTQIPTEQSS